MIEWTWWNVFWTSATAASSLVLLVKIGAYLIELRWQMRMAPSIRWEWSHRQDRASAIEDSYMHLQVHLRRPEPIFKQIRTHIRPAIAGAVFARLCTSPVLVLVSALSMTMAANSPPWMLDTAAFIITLAAAVMLMTALAGRLLLGPLDTLNSDLEPRSGLGGFQVADVTQLRLVYYFAILVFIAVVAGAGASAAVANGHAGAFSGAGLRSATDSVPDLDPIPYLYYSVVTIATVGYGDIFPQSDFGRLLTIVHIATGPLLFTWLIAVFTQTSAQAITAGSDLSSWKHEVVDTDCRDHDPTTCPWRIANPLAAG